MGASIRSLTLGGTAGTQTLAISSQTLTLAEASLVGPAGAINISGGSIAGAGSLEVDGAFNWSGGTITGSADLVVGGTLSLTGTNAKTLTTGRTLDKYGVCLTGLRRFDEAETTLAEAHAIVSGAVGAGHQQSAAVARHLAALYEAWGKPEEAARWKAAASPAAPAPSSSAPPAPKS